VSEKEILSPLLTDETETLHRLVEKAQRIFRINKKTGDIQLLPPRSKFTDRQLIAIYLLGRYFASKLELSREDNLDFDALRKLTGLEEGSITARVSELKKEGLVESDERGVYRVNYQSLENFRSLLEEIEGGILFGAAPIAPSRGVSGLEASLDSINLGTNTDGESVVLTLYANGAFPPSNLWMKVGEIIEWARNHGSLMNPETVRKWTLPQDPKLKQHITKKRQGQTVSYQLNRQGIKQAQRLTEGEAPGKVEGDS
jgi:uncharacterized protein YjhX (UPF0386 family)